MAYFTTDQLRAAAQKVRESTRKTDSEILREARETALDKFDIFLSHSSQDRGLVLGAKKLIEDFGYSVYVDWIDDAQRNTVVDRRLAERLRLRMRQCESLFYLHTPSAALSKWCPWELGFFDGLRAPEPRVFVVPVLAAGQSYRGQEYLDLYETVDLPTWIRPRRSSPTVDPFKARMLADHLGLMRRPGHFL